MTDLMISNVDEMLLNRLRERAERNCRSIEAEARTILTTVLQESPIDPWSEVRAIHARLAATGRQFGDSVEAIREDRQR